MVVILGEGHILDIGSPVDSGTPYLPPSRCNDIAQVAVLENNTRERSVTSV